MNRSSIQHLNHLLTEVPQRKILQRFLKVFVPISILFSGGYLAWERLNYSHQMSIQKAQESERLNWTANFLARDLEVIGSDMRLLSSSKELSAFINDSGIGNRHRLEERFSFFSRDRKIYDQIRFIDTAGMEIIRVDLDDQTTRIIQKPQLQNKLGRYYFRHMLQTPSDLLYVSPLDLNIENGRIETPLTPVVRVGKRLVNSEGHTIGILVFNYLASRMLDHFQSTFPQKEDRVYAIVNKDGWWLSHPEKSREWGWQLGHQQGLQNQNPDAWMRIKKNDGGQFVLGDAMYTYRRVRPYLKVTGMDRAGEKQTRSQDAGDLIIISEITSRSRDYFSKASLPVFVLVQLLLALAVWRWIQVQTIKRQWEDLTGLLSLAVDQSPAGIVLTDKKGNIEYVNHRFCQMTGYTLETVVGQNPRLLKSEEMADEQYDELWQTINSGNTWKGEFHNRRKDGSFFWAKAEISPVFDRKGRIGHYIGIQEDVTEQRRLSAELKTMANTDPLTDLSNRRHLYAQAKREVARCRRHHTELTVMLMDIDHFKSINDRWGHALGDRVLTELALYLKSNARANDILARFGGEEFIALFPDTDLDQAQSSAERFRYGIENLSLEHNGEVINLTVSIGCARREPGEDDIDMAVDRADKALYRAKENGRNLVCF